MSGLSDDVVALENAAGFPSTYAHYQALSHSSPLRIARCPSAQIVEEQVRAACERTGLRPKLAKTENGLTVWAGEDERIRSLAVRTLNRPLNT